MKAALATRARFGKPGFCARRRRALQYAGEATGAYCGMRRVSNARSPLPRGLPINLPICSSTTASPGDGREHPDR